MKRSLPPEIEKNLLYISLGAAAMSVLSSAALGSGAASSFFGVLFGLIALFAFIEARLKVYAGVAPEEEGEAELEHITASLPRAAHAAHHGDGAHVPLQLPNARLDGARLDGLDLRGAALEGLSAVGADLRKVALKGARLGEATLRDANLQGNTLDEVDLTRGVLDGANLSEVKATRLVWRGASLNRARGVGARLTHVDMREVVATQADFSQSQLEHVDLSQARLERVDLRQAMLRDCDLRRASLIQCKLDESTCTTLLARGAKLSGSSLKEAALARADLRESDLQKCSFKGASLKDAVLDGANLREADLHDADLTGASLKGVDLRGANLSGANLTGANLTDTDLSTCIHNMLTAWPEGVEPARLVGTLDEASLPELVDEPRKSTAALPLTPFGAPPQPDPLEALEAKLAADEASARRAEEDDHEERGEDPTREMTRPDQEALEAEAARLASAPSAPIPAALDIEPPTAQEAASHASEAVVEAAAAAADPEAGTPEDDSPVSELGARLSATLSKASSSGTPKVDLKNIPRINVRQPARDPQKTVPLGDDDVLFIDESLRQSKSAPPPPRTTSEQAQAPDAAGESEQGEIGPQEEVAAASMASGEDEEAPRPEEA